MSNDICSLCSGDCVEPYHVALLYMDETTRYGKSFELVFLCSDYCLTEWIDLGVLDNELSQSLVTLNLGGNTVNVCTVSRLSVDAPLWLTTATLARAAPPTTLDDTAANS